MSKYLSSNVRFTIVLVSWLVGGAVALFVPVLGIVAAILFAMVGIAVSVAFFYDWAMRGDEDMVAAREEMDRHHARIR